MKPLISHSLGEITCYKSGYDYLHSSSHFTTNQPNFFTTQRKKKKCRPLKTMDKPSTERVQAFADISRSALCCHSNETRASIANPPNTAQLEGKARLWLVYITTKPDIL